MPQLNNTKDMGVESLDQEYFARAQMIGRLTVTPWEPMASRQVDVLADLHQDDFAD